MKMDASIKAFETALTYIPGGVNSPVRAFRAVGGNPLFIRTGKGSRIEDLDGNHFIDYVNSWGPLILGHAHPMVVKALEDTLRSGTSFGAPTELETDLARKIVESVPSIEKVRFVNSGTEAVMSAIRLARGFTGRSRIIKFAGCYHGHSDSLLVKAGSGALTFGTPDSPGIPDALARETIVVPFNDLRAVETVMEQSGSQVACVILEPVAGNMGVVPPMDGFLNGLRDITKSYEALLIFDEVITGFRLGLGGAQALFGVMPDLTCLGKVIGGGLPVGAFGGRRDILQMLSPEGPVYQAGTLSGNPLAMAAGLATLDALYVPGFFESINKRGKWLAQEIQRAADQTGIPVRVQGIGSLFTVFFNPEPIQDLEGAQKSDLGLFRRFHRCLLGQGIYWPPSQFEACFLSSAHTETDLEITLKSIRKAFDDLKDA